MVLNCVLHRYNLPHVDKIIDMALAMGAEYLELANTQYYGWAHTNRAQLMPTAEQLDEAEAVVERYRSEIGERCKIFFVVPDYFETRPKRCMNGWGAVFLGIAPDGAALPCHTARSSARPDVSERQGDAAPGDLVRERRVQPLSRLRLDEGAVPQLRRKDDRLGGCRCQAYLLTGDPANADPVCDKSPMHESVINVVRQAAAERDPDEQPIMFRNDANSRLMSTQPTKQKTPG